MLNNKTVFRMPLGLALAVAALSPAAARTQQPVPDPLGDVVAVALGHNLRLEQAHLAEARAGAGVREARSRFLPSVALESRYSERNGGLDFGDLLNPAYAALNGVTGSDRFPTDLSLAFPLAHESRLRLTQPLFDARMLAGYSAARHRHEAVRLERMATARRVAAEVQVAWLRQAAARRAVGVIEAGLALVRENERVAQRLVEAGRATPEAVLRARAERSEVEQQLLEAREKAEHAARALNRLLGRALDAPVNEIPDTLLHYEIGMTEDELVAHALRRREELRALDAEIGAADAAVRLATAAFLPSVAVAVDYGFQGSSVSFGADEDFVVAWLVLSWGVFDGGRDVAARQGALLEAERQRLQQRDLEDAIRLEVRQAYASAVVALEAIGTAEDRLQAARRTFELVRRRYEEGVAMQIEFVDARAALTAAELNRVLTGLQLCHPLRGTRARGRAPRYRQRVRRR